jgi:hypothetical protein
MQALQNPLKIQSPLGMEHQQNKSQIQADPIKKKER